LLLIAGGDRDPNIGSILNRMHERGLEGEALLVGAGAHPAVTWDFQEDRLLLDGRDTRPTAAFLRYDVFTSLADPRPQTGYRAQTWYTTLHGWLLAHPVRVMNRQYGGQMNKPFMLQRAREAGLEIPHTLVTNELDRLEKEAAGEERIVKPVTGGGYTQMLSAVLEGTERRDGKSAAPAIVQRRLVAPEIRVYAVGDASCRRFEAFHVRSEQLDYRVDKTTEVVHLPLSDVAPEVTAGLGRLMDDLEMDYGAADFKTDPETGRLVFLEVNSSPMFVAFDAVSGHAVSDSILDYLLRDSA
jgi:hypothetical protein